jgi:exopolysaccharide biosynthesis polyprenyl glycosylphosphotransferase
MSSIARGRDELAVDTDLGTVGVGLTAVDAALGSVDTELRERQVTYARTRRPRRVGRLLATTDAASLVLAFLLAATTGATHTFDVTLGMLAAFLPALPAWALAAALAGHYDRKVKRRNLTSANELLSVFNLLTVGTWLAFIGSRALDLGWAVDKVIMFWATAFLLITVGRVVAQTVVRHSDDYIENAVIVGAGSVGQLVGRKLRHHPECGLRLVGFVDSSPRAMRADLGDVPVLGPPEEIADIVSRHDVQRVIISFSNDRHDSQLGLIRALQDLDVHIDLVPRLFEAIGPSVGMYAVEGLPLVGLPTANRLRPALLAKRAIDVVVAATAILFLSPLLLWIAFRIRRDSPGPVFFRQLRLGEKQQAFTVLKFRTMVEGVDDAPHREYVRGIMDSAAAPGWNNLYKLDRPEAVTKFGSWLRRTSLDELPQLFNVLRGDMSLVGPRPCIPYEVELFEPHHFDRFSVPAGMTGLWQLIARGHATFKEALDLDVTYARNWSLRLDLQLLARTSLVFFHVGRTT